VATVTTRSARAQEHDGAAFGLPAAAVLRRLKISREVAWYMTSRGIELPDCPPLVKTPEPSWVSGAAFDPERVDRVLAAFHGLRHTQGDFAGQPLDPDPWQVAYLIAPVFGWVRPGERGGWVRIIRNVTMDVPRKNGKTTLCGGLAIYLTAGDGEMGGQVIAAATTRDQARYVFDPIRQLAERAPALRGHVKALHSRIVHRRTGSYFGVISSKADTQHGANIHGAVIDELHVHKTPDLVEAIETGTGSRSQPLVFKITTADDGKPNTIYARNRHYIEQLARGIFRDESTYGVVFGLERDADPFLERNWKRANPGYGTSPTKEFFKAEANKARNSPAQLAAFKRLHLGIRTKQTTQYIDTRDWKLNAGPPIDEAELAGRICYGGLDLASVSDLTALCWLFPFEDGTPGYDAIWRYWTPEENIAALDDRTAGSASRLWVPNGWLITTPGNVTDYDFIRQQILADAETFEVQSIGFDRWNSSHLVNELMDEGIPVVKVGQGYMTMSPALKEVQRLVKMGAGGRPGDRRPRIRHGGNPVTLWNFDNLAVDMDPAGNVKPSKANSADKIDGVSAICDAMSEAMAAPEPKKSAYESGGLRAV
jgi:phage terminase large subunit-like protein